MKRSSFVARVAMFLVITYLVTIGATFNGVVIPTTRWIGLVLLGCGAAGWILQHWRGRWRWHHTPLDMLLLLWGAAFGLALLANPDSWRRIMIGLWYIGVYLVVWYALFECILNRAVTPVQLLDAALFGGIIVVLFGYAQAAALPFDLAAGVLPRPGSTLGNPNSLGGFLALLLPLITGRVFFPRHRAERVVMLCFAAAAGGLLILTFSRGAWLGAAAGLLGTGLVALRWRGVLSIQTVRQWWAQRSAQHKRRLIAGAMVAASAVVVGGIALTLLFARSFTQEGRSITLRTGIYQIAIDLTLEKPLTGHGLYTFGRGLERYHAMPPQTPHSHAHNIILHIAAELGIVGLAAMAVTVIVLLRAIRANIKAVPPFALAQPIQTTHMRSVLSGTTGSIIAFGVHHLTDTPAMMPLIALFGMLVLGLAVLGDPTDTRRVPALSAPWRRTGHALGMTGLCLALCVTGAWGTLHYDRYVTALRLAGTGDYVGAADRLNTVIASEPALTLYRWQQGYLYGMASLADAQWADEAIAAYEAYLTDEPQSAIAWANVGALYAQTGQTDAAIAALRRALEEAPLARQFNYTLGRSLEAADQLDEAREAYAQVLTADSAVDPFWEETAFRQSLAAEVTLSPIARFALDITAAEASGIPLDAAAVERWAQPGERRTTGTAVLYALGLLHIEESPAAAEINAVLVEAEALAANDADRAWVALGRAWLARDQGDFAGFAREHQTAQRLMAYDIGKADFIYGINLGYALFGRFVIPRQFLPGVYYPTADPALLSLLAHS